MSVLKRLVPKAFVKPCKRQNVLDEIRDGKLNCGMSMNCYHFEPFPWLFPKQWMPIAIVNSGPFAASLTILQSRHESKKKTEIIREHVNWFQPLIYETKVQNNFGKYPFHWIIVIPSILELVGNWNTGRVQSPTLTHCRLRACTPGVNPLARKGFRNWHLF